MIDYKELRKNYNKFKCEFLDSGTTADCFKISQSEVYKMFYNAVSFDEQLFGSLLQFEKINYNYILFPSELVVDNSQNPKYILGYITPYKESKTNGKAKVSNILNKASLLEQEVVSLSKNCIEIRDLWLQNTILSDETLYYIDTDYYESFDEYDEEIKKNNLSISNSVIFHTLIGMPLYKLIRFPLPYKLDEIHKAISSGEESVIAFLDQYIKYLEEETQKKIITLDELRNSSKKVLKKNNPINRVLRI